MFKSLLCSMLGHDWSNTTSVEMHYPILGTGRITTRKCARCGKEESTVDFSIHNSELVTPTISTNTSDQPNAESTTEKDSDSSRPVAQPAKKAAKSAVGGSKK